MPYFIKLVLLTTAMVFPLAVFVWWRGRGILGSLRWKGAQGSRKAFSWVMLSFLIYPLYLLIWFYGDMGISYNSQSQFLALYFWTGMVMITQLFWVLCTMLIMLFGFKWMARDFYQKRVRYIPVGASLLMILVMAGVIYQSYYSMNTIILDPEIVVDHASIADGEELRVVHISDLQADVFTDEDRIRNYIEKVNAQQPDLVFFTGDLITEGQSYIEEGARWLGAINSTYGVYAVYGDHDIWTGRSAVKEAYTRYGIQVLSNENKILSLPEASLKITGITHAYSERISDENLRTLLDGDDTSDIRISMAHQPAEKLVNASVDAGYDLFLAGHTHGGQIVQRFFFAEVNPAVIETPYPIGSFKVGGLTVNVNAGLGASLSPLRFGTPAAVSTILFQ